MTTRGKSRRLPTCDLRQLPEDQHPDQPGGLKGFNPFSSVEPRACRNGAGKQDFSCGYLLAKRRSVIYRFFSTCEKPWLIFCRLRISLLRRAKPLLKKVASLEMVQTKQVCPLPSSKRTRSYGRLSDGDLALSTNHPNRLTTTSREF